MTTAETLREAFCMDKGTLIIDRQAPEAETVKAMVFDAHQAGLGWDFGYEAVKDVLDAISDMDLTTGEEVQEAAHEIADSLTDLYTSDLTRWLESSPTDHVGLCEEAWDEFGAPESFTKALQLGQYQAYVHAANAVAAHWPEPEPEETFPCEECGDEYPEEDLEEVTDPDTKEALRLCPECAKDLATA